MTNGGSLYNQTSAGVDILAGDSVFIDLPEFNQSAYSGLYSMKYTIGSGITDDLPNDNEFVNEFLIDSLYTLAKLDANEMPIPADFYQPSGLNRNVPELRALPRPEREPHRRHGFVRIRVRSRR